MKRIVIGLVAAALLAVSVAASAQATVRAMFFWEDEWSFTEDCGFDVDVTGSAEGLLVLREGKNKIKGTFPVMNRFSYRETWRNPENGQWFVIRGQGLFIEVEATHVEGSIFEFRWVEAGQPFVVEDSDGKVVERNTGSVHATFLFDTEGDDIPGGIYLTDDDVIRVAGPHPSLEKHPCEYAVELIG
ncbi:MAG: hypothetical protein R6X23_06290 [Acidimicrobiia bacterium]